MMGVNAVSSMMEVCSDRSESRFSTRDLIARDLVNRFPPSLPVSRNGALLRRFAFFVVAISMALVAGLAAPSQPAGLYGEPLPRTVAVPQGGGFGARSGVGLRSHCVIQVCRRAVAGAALARGPELGFTFTTLAKVIAEQLQDNVIMHSRARFSCLVLLFGRGGGGSR